MNLVISDMRWNRDNSVEARLDCRTTEEFLTMPSDIIIDGKYFKKISFRPDCQFASYERKIEVFAVSIDRAGTFEIVAGESPVTRTTITVQN